MRVHICVCIYMYSNDVSSHIMCLLDRLDQGKKKNESNDHFDRIVYGVPNCITTTTNPSNSTSTSATTILIEY